MRGVVYRDTCILYTWVAHGGNTVANTHTTLTHIHIYTHITHSYTLTHAHPSHLPTHTHTHRHTHTYTPLTLPSCWCQRGLTDYQTQSGHSEDSDLVSEQEYMFVDLQANKKWHIRRYKRTLMSLAHVACTYLYSTNYNFTKLTDSSMVTSAQKLEMDKEIVLP